MDDTGDALESALTYINNMREWDVQKVLAGIVVADRRFDGENAIEIVESFGYSLADLSTAVKKFHDDITAIANGV